MSPKRITYLLVGIIALLLILISFSIHNVYKRDLLEDERINNLISGFEDKFHKDSLNLVKSNKLLIDQISQSIIDSISIAYEEKLQIALTESEKYKKLLTENNITVSPPVQTANNITTHTKPSITSKTNAYVRGSNVTTYSKLVKKSNTLTNKKANVTTYSKLPKKSNVTTYSKLVKKPNTSTNKRANVTTYSKLNKVTTASKKTNVTTYSQLDKSSSISNKYQSKKTKKKVFKNNNTQIIHNNYDLDNATNINDVQYVPVYSGCEAKYTEFDKKNCFATKISMHILTNFNTATVQNTGLTSGIKKLRVLFIIDKNGKTKVSKIVGKWPKKISLEVIRSVESVPRMKPGTINGKATTVKYSLQIPFTIS